MRFALTHKPLDAAVANNQLNRAPLLVFEITVLDNEVVTYLAVIHEGKVSPSQLARGIPAEFCKILLPIRPIRALEQ